MKRKRRPFFLVARVLLAAASWHAGRRTLARNVVSRYVLASSAGPAGSGTSCEVHNLAAVHRGAAAEQLLAQLEALVAEVQASGQPHLVGQHRNFGEYVGQAAGHEVVYLHQHLSESLLAWLWDLAVSVAGTLPTWDLLKYAGGQTRPALRCLEAIDYFPKAATAAGTQQAGEGGIGLDSLGSALSWHHDGATICTMIVALSTSGEDFDGGELQVRDRQAGKELLQTVSDLRRGDVAAWRGWDLHRVCPVRRGQRRVVVAEWWLGPPCSAVDERPRDSEDVVRRAMQVDGSAAQLHVLLAQVLVEEGDLEGAARSCQAATQLDPEHVEAHHALGVILAAKGDLADAEKSFRTTLRLDPRQPKAHYNLGKCLFARGDIRGAELSFRAALQLDPLAAALRDALAACSAARDGRGTPGPGPSQPPARAPLGMLAPPLGPAGMPPRTGAAPPGRPPALAARPAARPAA